MRKKARSWQIVLLLGVVALSGAMASCGGDDPPPNRGDSCTPEQAQESIGYCVDGQATLICRGGPDTFVYAVVNDPLCVCTCDHPNGLTAVDCTCM